jgi:predicted Fe-S protein YdhL (DUF1289 family)
MLSNICLELILYIALLQNHYIVPAAKCFFIAAATTDIICTIQKMSLFCVGCYRPIQKITTYVSRHEKMIFRKKKKLLNPNLGSARRQLLAEVKVDRATKPPERRRLLV